MVTTAGHRGQSKTLLGDAENLACKHCSQLDNHHYHFKCVLGEWTYLEWHSIFEKKKKKKKKELTNHGHIY
jgi:hypothetical protein